MNMRCIKSHDTGLITNSKNDSALFMYLLSCLDSICNKVVKPNTSTFICENVLRTRFYVYTRQRQLVQKTYSFIE